MLSQRNQRVLVVDDDDSIRTMVERVLRRSRCEVDMARDGFEAIEKLSRNDYDAVLLDLMMPRLDGRGVLRYLEEEHAADRPRVVVMTAYVQALEEANQPPPAYPLLAKPFNIQDLVARVQAGEQRP